MVSIKCDLFQGHVQEPVQESLPQEIQVILTTLSSKKMSTVFFVLTIGSGTGKQKVCLDV